MQCEICQNREATIHLTEISDGIRTESHLCEQCAAEQGVAVKSNIPINELLSGLLSVQPPEEQAGGITENDNECPNCGFTLDDFREKAVLGCPHDYEVFEQNITPLIKKAHDGNGTHRGKVPSKVPVDSKRELELAELRRQLDKAVRTEDYERAAELRDRIAEIE
jgi:protein arginine kinase activator